MKPNEIERIVRILHKFGVEYVKLTGGEPMLRSDIIEIVKCIKSVGIKEVSMTTNGVRLPNLVYQLKINGLDRVNISLHSLDHNKFRFITRTDALDNTLKAIENSIDAGLNPVKLNIVILKDVNDDEIDDMIEYSCSLGGSKTNVIQFIELLKVDTQFYDRYFLDLSKIEDEIAKKAAEIRFRRLQNRPVYILRNGVQVEFVKPMYNHAFCMGNDRIRITYDGKFKPCLLRSDNHVDFLTAMRSGATDEDLEKLYMRAVLLREPYFKEGEEEHPYVIESGTCII
jgi:cyclic pyranopterin phosphate synthase